MGIRGLEGARKQLDDIVKNIGDDAISQWFQKVADTTNAICPEAHVRFESGKKQGNIGRIITPTKRSIECVIKAIDQVIKEAPEPSKTMLKDYKTELQKHLAIQ